MPSVTLRLQAGKRSFPRFDSGGRPLPALEPDKDYEFSAATEGELWHKILPFFNHCELVEGVLPKQPKPQSPSLGRYVAGALNPQAPEQKPQTLTLYTCPHCAVPAFNSAPGLARHLMRAHADKNPEIDVMATNAKGQLINDLSPWLALVEGTAAPAVEEETPSEEAEEVVGGLPESNPLEDAIANALLGVEKARQKAVCAAVADSTGAPAEAVEAAWEALLEAGKLEAVGRWDYRLANP